MSSRLCASASGQGAVEVTPCTPAGNRPACRANTAQWAGWLTSRSPGCSTDASACGVMRRMSKTSLQPKCCGSRPVNKNPYRWCPGTAASTRRVSGKRLPRCSTSCHKSDSACGHVLATPLLPEVRKLSLVSNAARPSAATSSHSPKRRCASSRSSTPLSCRCRASFSAAATDRRSSESRPSPCSSSASPAGQGRSGSGMPPGRRCASSSAIRSLTKRASAPGWRCHGSRSAGVSSAAIGVRRV